MKRKQVLATLEEAGIHFDKLVARKNGSFEIRNGYFYHRREADEARLIKIKTLFPKANVFQQDHFAAWPRDSWMSTFIVPNEEE